MPTYHNANRTDAQTSNPPCRIPARSSVETNKYIKDLPPGVTLTSHLPLVSPWVLLATVSSYPSEEIVVAGYDSLMIYNASSGVILVSANGDDDNALRVLPMSQNWMDNKRIFGVMQILSNEESGVTYVYGLMEA